MYRERIIKKMLNLNEVRSQTQTTKEEQKAEEGELTEMEKRDYVAMLLAAVITLFPAAILIFFLLSFALIQLGCKL